MNCPRWIDLAPLPRPRQLALAGVILVLHGALLWAGWGPEAPAEAPLAQELPPLQVMLITERAGSGDAPLARSRPAGRDRWAAPAPPPTAQPEVVAVESKPDRAALPLTAPDLSPLAALPAPRSSIRLRLHIEASGEVSRVEVLESDPEDALFVQRLVEVLLATPHIPARRDGRDVASNKELALNFGGAG